MLNLGNALGQDRDHQLIAKLYLVLIGSTTKVHAQALCDEEQLRNAVAAAKKKLIIRGPDAVSTHDALMGLLAMTAAMLEQHETRNFDVCDASEVTYEEGGSAYHCWKRDEAGNVGP